LLADRTATQYDRLLASILSSVRPSVCDAVHCGCTIQCTEKVSAGFFSGHGVVIRHETDGSWNRCRLKVKDIRAFIQVSEQVNMKSPRRTRVYNFQPPIPTSSPILPPPPKFTKFASLLYQASWSRDHFAYVAIEVMISPINASCDAASIRSA